MFDPERGAWAKELKEDDALLHLTKAEANNMVARWACRRYIYMITVRSRPIDDTDLRAMILLHCFLLPGAMDWDPCMGQHALEILIACNAHTSLHRLSSQRPIIYRLSPQFDLLGCRLC